MARWVLMGVIEKTTAGGVCREGDAEEVLFPARALRNNAEIKHSFEAPSQAVATVVRDVFNGDIPDGEASLRDWGAHYGYRVRKKRKGAYLAVSADPPSLRASRGGPWHDTALLSSDASECRHADDRLPEDICCLRRGHR